MKVLALVNEKGGVGKTTNAIHIGAGLAIRGLTVLIVDADPQGHATIGLGIAKKPGIYDLIVRDESWANVMLFVPEERYASVDTGCQGELFLVPGNVETRGIPDYLKDDEQLRDRMEELDGVVDVVVFDTSPSASKLHGAIYMAADSVLFPVIPSALALDGLMESTRHQEAASARRRARHIPELKIAGILPNLVDATGNAHLFGMRKLRERFGTLLWEAMPKRTEIEKASFKRQTLFAWSPLHEATGLMWQVVDQTQRTVLS